ncbi:MAG: hypothetical protein GF353_12920 [Candidatus Lokiarchaeota archaeon]|nr:hypothetical protein [Candidatus Lokiarchaeota archaeon]
MSENKYSELIRHLEEMISDGVQLVHGGHLLEWSDTKIPAIIAALKEEIASEIPSSLNPGDKLKNRKSGQIMWVVDVEKDTVYLNADTPTIKYPLVDLLKEFIYLKNSK